MIGSVKVVVAHGTVHRDLTLNHHEPLRPGHVKVSVDFVEIGYLHERIPVPSSYAKKLGEAEGSFTQWPKDLVLLCHDNEVSIPREQSGTKNRLRSDVTQLLIGDRLSVSILQVFMLAMIDRYPYKFDLNSITFMCPSKVSATILRSSPDASLKYMRHVMEQSLKDSYFVHIMKRTIGFFLCFLWLIALYMYLILTSQEFTNLQLDSS
ncbi:uncharacterized protein [Euphorbia lathyris]|uniref:uncharacterized protein isoform X2 n=1 Tax=Euphorbia lathyris TaxID=212925 RepID=UPI003313346D